MDTKKLIYAIAKKVNENVKIKINETVKDNGVKLQGLYIINPNNRVTPVIYIDRYMRDIDDELLTYDQVADEILETYYGALDNADMIDSLISQKKMFNSENVYMQILNAENNKERLKGGVVHKEFLDMVIVYKSVFGETEDGSMTLTIRDEQLDEFGVSEEEFKQKALENTSKQNFKAISLYEVVKDLMCKQMGIDGDDLPYLPDGDNGISDMYVLGAGTKYGAICLYTKDGIRELAEEIQSDLYLLPSSIHEVIAIPKAVADENNMEEQDMKDMVMSINADVLDVADFLSDRIYYYSRENDEVSISC